MPAKTVVVIRLEVHEAWDLQRVAARAQAAADAAAAPSKDRGGAPVTVKSVQITR